MNKTCGPDHGARTGSIGISAIAVYEPPWVLENAWFGNSLPRKFVQHTGIRSRRICQDDEIAMAVRAVECMQPEIDCDLRDCAALVFVLPSVVIDTGLAQQTLDSFVRRLRFERDFLAA